MARPINVGMIGYKFMGKAHSNAFLKAPKFFPLSRPPVMRAICGRNESAVRAFGENWGWESYETDYRELIRRDDIDLVDIATPNDSHADIAIAAARAGKDIICEKPLGMNVKECREMLAAVREHKVRHMVWFNYRRVPALALARKLIDEGRIGKIYHVRAVYLQDWIMDPKFPLVWRLQKGVAGSGSHGDLNAHIIDMARYLVGEFKEVCGLAETFIKERPVEASSGLLSAKGGRKKGKVTVDDAVLFLARFKNGAIGTFEATRFANGHKNGNKIEVNGSKGSLVFHFEDMNQLQFFSSDDPAHMQGFRTILATTPGQTPYMEAWWPPGHIVGYEHTFINQAADLFKGIAAKKKLSPDFEDGLRCQEVLDGVMQSVKERGWVGI